MGILFSCFRSSTVIEGSNRNDDVINWSDGCFGSGASIRRDEIGLVNRSQKEPEAERESEPEPEPVLESDRLKKDDCILSRDEECPICLEEYTDENPMITTKCSHSYHLGCLYDWQERSGQCPTCLGVMEFQEIS